jgi:hypothetical protein
VIPRCSTCQLEAPTAWGPRQLYRQRAVLGGAPVGVSLASDLLSCAEFPFDVSDDGAAALPYLLRYLHEPLDPAQNQQQLVGL